MFERGLNPRTMWTAAHTLSHLGHQTTGKYNHSRLIFDHFDNAERKTP